MLEAAANQKRHNAEAARRLAESAQQRLDRSRAEQAERQVEEADRRARQATALQEQQRTAFRAAGHQANQEDLEMQEVDLGVPKTPPYRPPPPLATNGELM